VSDLLIGALSALLATNPPTALSNLVHARTGIPIPVPNANDPIEKEYLRLLEMDDEAQAQVDQWIRENQSLNSAGAGLDPVRMRAKTLARFDTVKKAYDSFLAAHPDHARARLAYGGFLSDIGEEEPAFTQWEKARELDPKNPVTWNNLANFYGHNGPVTNAFACYARALELQPGEPLYSHNFATTVFLFRKDAMEFFNLTEPQVFDKALGLYRQARALDPDNFLLAKDLAQCYYVMKPPKSTDAEATRKAEQKLADEALAEWQAAFKIAPDENTRQGVYVHFARWQINAGRFDEARKTLSLLTNGAFSSTKRALEKKMARVETEPAATNAPPKRTEDSPSPKPR
jgi:tetratricopeptide (TPR) repeat protein